MSWFLVFGIFIVLIVAHEAGHFAAAKAVGMRVERFSLFFPPLILRKKIGETEYAIGALPLGGYVKISGMSPAEDLPDEVRTRAYHAQPPWKRVVTIARGPGGEPGAGVPAAVHIRHRDRRPGRHGAGRHRSSATTRPSTR